MSLPWATPGEKGCPCAVFSLTATAQYCVCRLCACFCVVGKDCPRWLSLRVSPVGHPPLYMSIHNPVLSVPSVAVPDLFVDLSGLQQAFQLKQVEKFLETIVKKRGNIYLEWWAQWKALQGFSLWPAHSLKQLKLPVPRDASSGWITGAVHTVWSQPVCPELGFWSAQAFIVSKLAYCMDISIWIGWKFSFCFEVQPYNNTLFLYVYHKPVANLGRYLGFTKMQTAASQEISNKTEFSQV